MNDTGLQRLIDIMAALRDPQSGCPWDRQQDFRSITPYTIEEAYEVAAAIRSGDTKHMEEELGDLLLQTVFHAELGTETGAFDFDSICHAISDKLIRRHPHVYGESDVETTEGVLQQWDQIKAEEKAAKPKQYLEKVGEGFPGLLRA